jgi:hypothetical protein
MAEKTEFVLGANFGTPYGSGSQLIFSVMCLSVVGMSFMKMFMAIDWKPFQYCYCLVFSYFSFFYIIKKSTIYIPIT